MAPMMGMPPMDMGMMLGTHNPMMPMPYMMGWVMHFIIGIILTWIYAAILIDKLPSDGWKRGMIFSLIPWALMQIVVMPMMMNLPVLSGGDMVALMATIVAHLAYGGVMGAIYTGATAEAALAAVPAPEPTPEPEPTPAPDPTPEPEPPAEEDTPSGDEESRSGEEESE